jgi:hypothetical protein
MIVLPNAYLAPIVHYALIAQNDRYAIDAHENFVKQTYRSRAEIYGANGKLKLIVPLQKRKNQTPMHEVEISYEEDWQRLHWRSFESAYRLSPYFEYYEEEFLPFYENKKYSKLLEFNLALEEKIKTLLGLNSSMQLTKKYEEQEIDYRQLIKPKQSFEQIEFSYYIQVFTEKYGFIPNLSILDLLFNLGPASTDYLKQLTLKF